MMRKPITEPSFDAWGRPHGHGSSGRSGRHGQHGGQSTTNSSQLYASMPLSAQAHFDNIGWLVIVRSDDHRCSNYFEVTATPEAGFVLGRERGCQLAFPRDQDISNRHAEIILLETPEGYRFFIHDLRSTNHTIVRKLDRRDITLSDPSQLLELDNTSFIKLGGHVVLLFLVLHQPRSLER